MFGFYHRICEGETSNVFKTFEVFYQLSTAASISLWTYMNCAKLSKNHGEQIPSLANGMRNIHQQGNAR